MRIGEAILLGHDTVSYKPIKGAFTDSFLLEANNRGKEKRWQSI